MFNVKVLGILITRTFYPGTSLIFNSTTNLKNKKENSYIYDHKVNFLIKLIKMIFLKNPSCLKNLNFLFYNIACKRGKIRYTKYVLRRMFIP